MMDTQQVSSAVLQKAQAYLLQEFNQEHDPRLVYHNYQHTSAVVQQVAALAKAEHTNATTSEIAQLAAWFAHIGYLHEPQNAQQVGIPKATIFLETNNYPHHDKVLACLTGLNQKTPPTETEQRLLQDALQAIDLVAYTNEGVALLRLEEELLYKRQMGRAEWEQYLLQRLMQMRFWLPSSKEQFEPLLAQQILTQKKAVEKANRRPYTEDLNAGKLRKFQAIERKVPNSAIQTFFRANYRNHINLSAIADNKANIMISVNAIIISVLISILSYGNVMETRPMILMPVVIFLISGLTSLIFAVLSARPKVTRISDKHRLDEAKRNIVFFGNFVQLDLDQYEEAMDAMFRSSELIYGNMTRDLYHLGKVLDQKYSYLSISYTVFMIGFAATVVTFLVAILV